MSEQCNTWLVLPGQTVELRGAAEGRVHLVGAVEEAIVHLVLAGLLFEGDERLKAVAPENLTRQIGGPGLRRHARGLDDTWGSRKEENVKTEQNNYCNWEIDFVRNNMLYETHQLIDTTVGRIRILNSINCHCDHHVDGLIVTHSSNSLHLPL